MKKTTSKKEKKKKHSQSKLIVVIFVVAKDTGVDLVCITDLNIKIDIRLSLLLEQEVNSFQKVSNSETPIFHLNNYIAQLVILTKNTS